MRNEYVLTAAITTVRFGCLADQIVTSSMTNGAVCRHLMYCFVRTCTPSRRNPAGTAFRLVNLSLKMPCRHESESISFRSFEARSRTFVAKQRSTQLDKQSSSVTASRKASFHGRVADNKPLHRSPLIANQQGFSYFSFFPCRVSGEVN